MSDHALLSPSSAHRWLNCPRAARLEATLPAKTSIFAEEGTLAHSVCEVTAKKHFGKIKAAAYTRAIKRLKENKLWNAEMLLTAETYVEHLSERAMSFDGEPYVAFEVQVDISDYVPESFGRCDCAMFGGDTLIITDYKHGQGVPVSPAENPQMLLYALGALKLYKPLFGNDIKNIQLWIDQPRIDSYEGWNCTVDFLLKWGESIKDKAQLAFMGFGDFYAGAWCQFCRANGQCRAQAEQRIGAFDDFSNLVGKPADLLTPEQMRAVLDRGETLVDWYKCVRDTALGMILSGTDIPGYKAVEGRSNRAWSDADKALETLEEAGIDEAMLYDRVPKTLAQIEKLLGKSRFADLVGSFVMRPPGKPTLTAASNTKPAYNSAASDFAGVSTDAKS